MSEPQLRLMTGDPYLCERALATRELALMTLDPDIERHGLFADEIDTASLDIELRSCSLFALGRHFVIRKIEKNRSAKTLAAVLDRPIPDGTYLTLLAGPLKATNAVFKAVARNQDAVLSLPTPKGTALQRTTRGMLEASGLTLPNAVARTLLTECGDDLLSLHNELEKLRSLAGPDPIHEETARGLCFNHTEATVYPFYDRLGEGQLPAALNELDELRDDAGRIVGGIIRHFTRLVMVRLLLDQRLPQSEIAVMMGMQDWLCRRLIGQAKRRPFEVLVKALRTGVKLDQRIKQGRVAPDDALMQLILTAIETATDSATALG
jgi:DNA polymerase III delta subunit